MRIPDGQPQAEPSQDSATTAIPVQEHPDSRDSRSATEKLNTTAPPGNGTKTTRPRRGGGGLSAQELLRREGRY